MFGTIMLMQGISPFVMDIVFEMAGSYDPALIALGATLLACAAAIALLPAHPSADMDQFGSRDDATGRSNRTTGRRE